MRYKFERNMLINREFQFFYFKLFLENIHVNQKYTKYWKKPSNLLKNIIPKHSPVMNIFSNKAWSKAWMEVANAPQKSMNFHCKREISILNSHLVWDNLCLAIWFCMSFNFIWKIFPKLTKKKCYVHNIFTTNHKW